MVQVALRHLGAAVDRVDVRVLEARTEQPLADVDHLGGRSRQGAHVGVAADGTDATTGHRHRARARSDTEPGEEATADEDQLGR